MRRPTLHQPMTETLASLLLGHVLRQSLDYAKLGLSCPVLSSNQFCFL